MEQREIKKILNDVKNGNIEIDDAILKIKLQPFEDLGFAKLDSHRGVRQGVSEIIYGASKTPEQIKEISLTMYNNGQKTILITRMSAEAVQIIPPEIPFTYDKLSKVGIIGKAPEIDGKGKIIIATGGTSDMAVAEEAALTAQALGNDIIKLYDVGVAGIHRLLSNIDIIMNARVIIAIAGMEGALASVISGLAQCPVIAVPTSVGYGANFGGLAALLSMLNSCASGISVVNIDNGFGAAYQASLINHI